MINGTASSSACAGTGVASQTGLPSTTTMQTERNRVITAYTREIKDLIARSVGLESLMRRFLCNVSQVSGGDFFLIVPGVEGDFGGADGSGDGQVHIDRIAS
jgi:hypothetical protein